MTEQGELVKVSTRQAAIMRYMAAKGGRMSARPQDWMAVPLPDAPRSEDQMGACLDRLAVRGLVERRPGRVYRLTDVGFSVIA